MMDSVSFQLTMNAPSFFAMNGNPLLCLEKQKKVQASQEEMVLAVWDLFPWWYPAVCCKIKSEHITKYTTCLFNNHSLQKLIN